MGMLARKRPSTQAAFLASFGSGAKAKWGTPEARVQAIWRIVGDLANSRRPLTQLKIARRHGVNRKFVQAVEGFFVPVPGREVRRQRVAAMVGQGVSYQAAGTATGLSTQQAKRIATARGQRSRFEATHGRRLSPEERARLRAELDSGGVTAAARNAGVTLSTAQRERNKWRSEALRLQALYHAERFEDWVHLRWPKLREEGKRILKEVLSRQSLYERAEQGTHAKRKDLLLQLLEMEAQFVEYAETSGLRIPDWFNRQAERHAQAWRNLIGGK